MTDGVGTNGGNAGTDSTDSTDSTAGTVPRTAGLLLAAGAGRRAGGPKALRRDPDGRPAVVSAARELVAGGCADVVVVVGCRADDVAAELRDEPADVVVAEGWGDGLSASLRAGLSALDPGVADVAVVQLVDLPDVGAPVVRRVLAAGPVTRTTLRRAVFDDRPGHPVLIGAEHWSALADQLTGDRGARAYLEAHGCRGVPCEDLASGHDLDDPEPTR